MNKKNKNIYWIIGIIGFIIIGFIFLRGFGLLSVLGVSESLDYKTEWRFNDLDTGIGVSEAILTLPDLTNEFSFTVYYSGQIESIRGKGTCRVDVDYEIYNFKNNRWEKFHDRSWTLREYGTRSAELRFNGERIYIAGIPEKIAEIMTRYDRRSSNRRYDYYLSCKNGMSVSQMLNLIEKSKEGDSRYTFKCLYPENYISEHEDGDEYWEHNDLIYFPKLNTYGLNYIKNNSAKFRIQVNKKSNCQSLDEKDFRINLWDVKTDLVKYYRFKNNGCEEIELMTYQKTANDYESLFECQEKIIVDRWILEDNTCNLKSIKYTEIDSNTFQDEKDCLNSRNFFLRIWNWIKSLFINIR